jgi:hypothetical protein
MSAVDTLNAPLVTIPSMENTSTDADIINIDNINNIAVEPFVVQNDEHFDPQFNTEFMHMQQDKVKHFTDGQQSKNTLKKTMQDVIKMKREVREIQQIPHEELNTLLASFILTTGKKDGSEYEPSTLRGMISSIDRKPRRHKYAHSIISNCNDTAFNLTRQALKEKQKQQGKGNKPNRAKPLTEDEIEQLYEAKLLGNSSPESMLNTVWLNNTIHFGLIGSH